MTKNRFKVVCFMRIEPEEQEPMTLRAAKDEVRQQECMQPENIYKIEPVMESD